MGQAREEGGKLPTTSMVPMAEHKTLHSAKEESLGVCGTKLWEAADVFTPLFITGANP